MLDRIRNLFGGTPRQVTNERLIPDPARVVAGFEFRISSTDHRPEFVELAKELEAALRRELERRGVKANKAGLAIDSPRFEHLYKALKEVNETGLFGRETGYAAISGKFVFALVPESPGWEWFEIRPHTRSSIDFNSWACRADRMPTGLTWVDNNFMTERSRRVIDEAGLSGLEFTWVRDLGRYQAEQWYHAMATKPLGRGLDHPFLDATKFNQPDYVKRWASPEEWRFGKWWLKKSEFSSTARFGVAALDGLVGLCNSDALEVKGFRQMLREFIPATDFAYVWSYALPSLCCNGRAREVLLKNKLLAAEDFSPIWIWDEAPKGAVILDRKEQKCVRPYPMAAEIWKEIEEKVRTDLTNFLAHPKTPCVTTATEALAQLRAAHSTSVKPPLKGVPDLPKLPKLWEDVLRSADDFWMLTTWASERKTTGWEVVLPSDLAGFQKMTEESAQHFIPDFPNNQVHFAHDGCGNWLSFDLNKLTPEGDCRVTEWRHDTLCREREWPSIVQLLEESLELEKQEEED